MKYEKLEIQDVMLLTPEVFGDQRGFFMETFRQSEFQEKCGNYQFVQDNYSRSEQHTLRGLHYQLVNPQGKLVRVTQGKVFDVVVDLRQKSTTFGQWLGVYLSSENNHILWVPPGFAHGFYVLSECADFQYKCTEYYDPKDEFSLLWKDATVNIDWPLVEEGLPIISDKDNELHALPWQSCPKFDGLV